ncbi:Mce-associated membrane protein [Crossiella equi]|uniref:Mce-associated membrane protein n=1 Tax=Crossiella equi TaxID=130796 RepID=A0ABS5A8Z4_9PSEU|nr:nuclear transport factor 2 family protein [Crossiella equi]MBP2473041.1 Mce-associated membrane protein [Crossiella equi]
MTRVLAVLTVLALVAAGWSGYTWWQATADPDHRQAAERDLALQAGSRAVVQLNTLDHRTVEEGLDQWRAWATGPLSEELAQNRDQNARDIRTARTTTTAKLLSAALTTLDARAGAATMVAALAVTLTRDAATPATHHTRVAADLVRTAEGWRVARLQPLGAAA